MRLRIKFQLQRKTFSPKCDWTLSVTISSPAEAAVLEVETQYVKDWTSITKTAPYIGHQKESKKKKSDQKEDT